MWAIVNRTNLIIPSANLFKVLAVVKAASEFTISEKRRIRASSLRADVRYVRVRIKDFYKL